LPEYFFDAVLALNDAVLDFLLGLYIHLLQLAANGLSAELAKLLLCSELVVDVGLESAFVAHQPRLRADFLDAHKLLGLFGYWANALLTAYHTD